MYRFFQRYLESGAEDCENTAKLIESLMLILQAVKCEMQAEVERLEARQFERTNFTKMVEVIDSVTKDVESEIYVTSIKVLISYMYR